MRRLARGGPYVRVCDATWRDCADTEPSKRFGGRWNARGRFGVLYLCASRAVAAANARCAYERDGRYTLFDRRPDRRPHLQVFTVAQTRFVNAVTPAGIAALGLPATFPFQVTYAACRPIGAGAYDEGELGIASRSAAEATRENVVGEELALFDSALSLVTAGQRLAFNAWYPLPNLIR